MLDQSLRQKEEKFNNITIDSLISNSRLTAKGGKASPSTIKFYEKFCKIKDRKKTAILDYGCGRKRNGLFLKSKGFEDITLYDINPVDSEVTERLDNSKKYEIILLNYVLNVVPLVTRIEIMEKIREISCNNCMILVEVRGINQVEYARKKSPNKWLYNEELDGYLVTRTKNGYKVYLQKGFKKGELEEFLGKQGYSIAHTFYGTKEKTSVVIQNNI